MGPEVGVGRTLEMILKGGFRQISLTGVRGLSENHEIKEGGAQEEMRSWYNGQNALKCRLW